MDIVVWASNILKILENDLNYSSDKSSQELISCQQQFTKNICEIIIHPKDYDTVLSDILEYAYKKLQSTPNDSSPFYWRKLYTDVALIWSLLDITRLVSPSDISNDSIWRAPVARLDRAIIIAGAAGEGRLDLILDTIERIQSAYLPLNIPLTTVNDSRANFTSSASINLKEIQSVPNTCQSIPALLNPPSLTSFVTKYSKAPFILRGFALDWPAISDHPWSSKSYLQSVAGRARIIPVEIGNDYRADDWSQKFMDWGDYLDYLFLDRSQTTERSSSEMIYLAQHNLFRQFEKLRWDIVIPDYVYTQLPPPEYFSQYKEPGNDEKLVMNGWLGPENAMSPAHTDPYYNFYTQIVGRKTIWLAPPTISNAMFPYNCNSSDSPKSPSSSYNNDDSAPRNPATNQMNPALSNSSRIDVFRDIKSNMSKTDDLEEEYKVFEEVVVPEAMGAVLEPGDMLFFPPGWWHAMRCEDTSFSVSLWF